ncbi:NAD(P)/FAD-dependent oxidoreductase [Actinocrispum wychmicini]|uniref:Sarcosine oxidase subunit beta n=1 Tax=Actinocrispum wychmicini TaxID=1213861 RepID=A0A4R2IH70_9PSEU|nr:FAD-binding oxidoreductase [Actinocrispum wychmicini]TCO44241.1 sarcosine oxidase subunit beta [Actinocrispum wychmicini]
MKADVVVIGGGVMGVSTTFHLAAAGVNVLLLERDSLGSGSTSRAAGGVRAQFSDPVNIALGQHSLAAFERFAQDPGFPIDLRQNGYLFLLDKSSDVDAFTAGVELQNSMGVPSRMIDVAEACALSPLIAPTGLLAAAYSPRDGHCTPEAVVQGYAAAARRLGATILSHTEVTGISVSDGEITGVRTVSDFVTTSVVVCTAGAWSAAIGEMAGVPLPVRPLRRQIRVTSPLPWLPPGLPMTIDFGSTFYFHPEGPGLLFGMSDPDQEYGFDLHVSDEWLDRLGPVVERRAPQLADVGIARGWAGLYEVSPDHNAMVGESPDISRFLYATGFSGHGFLQGPAIGEVIRDLVLGHSPFVDVSSLDARRFAGSFSKAEHNTV